VIIGGRFQRSSWSATSRCYKWVMDVAALARLGFLDPIRADRLLDNSEDAAPAERDVVVSSVAMTADPDGALEGLAAIRRALPAVDQQDFGRCLAADETFRRRLCAVLGASEALRGHLARHPRDWVVLRAAQGPKTVAEMRDSMMSAVGARQEASGEWIAANARDEMLDALRLAYRRLLLHICARDLTGETDVVAVSAELADLAGATLEVALAVARAGMPLDSAKCRLAIIAMGKCGGKELNYVSDVDVIFVADTALRTDPPDGQKSSHDNEATALRAATLLATGVTRVCSASTAEGTIWPVDAALRPEGKAGPLVRTLDSHLAYYRRWAQPWEFQALLKARPIAGDLSLGESYVTAIAPLVWQAAGSPGFVTDVQAMRRRVEAAVSPRDADRQLKLGPGGLRDVEFAVQLLQLVHGRSDPRLRSGGTLAALAALADGGYVGREDAAALDEAYRFLRTVEHRIQLHKLRRTHVMPTGDADVRRLGRSLGFLSDPVADCDRVWREHRREVQAIHRKLFYRPLLDAVARLTPVQARWGREAASARLVALGYHDPVAALRHLESLTAGVSRRAAIQRTLLPVLLGWFADAPDPDAVLLAFRQVSDSLGRTPWFLRLLRDSGAAAEQLARVLASGRYPVDLLLRAPDAVAMLGDDRGLHPRPLPALITQARVAAGRHADPAAAVAAVRALRGRELFRVAVADVLGFADVHRVGGALTDIAVASVAAALEIATHVVENRLGERLATRVAIIAMGRFGGAELAYASDADVLFVHQPRPDASERRAQDTAHAVVSELRALLAAPGPDPVLSLDADLRPEGRQGVLVRSVDSYAAYYGRWSQPWESQALLRAVAVAGDPEVGARFLDVIDPIRWPAGGVPESAIREIRRLKARMESERLPRGVDPTLHTKLGRGGLSDVEWVVQLIQLRHASTVPTLRTTSTMAALRGASEAGLLAAEDARILGESWMLASELRNASMLVRGRPGESIPSDQREYKGVTRLLGDTDVRERYLRVSRRARVVMERLFYD
jgi:[glutamine synthetase] adenylyltransferase / [glutamine synthetase]-adenylyl-L-tyrosine phosphorylase